LFRFGETYVHELGSNRVERFYRL